MVRGFSYNGTSYAITDFSANHARNPISEQGMGLGGEPKIYDGTNLITGSVSAMYRDALGVAFAQPIIDLLSGSSSVITPAILIASDEFGGGSFPSSFVNSFEMSLQTKALGTCSMNWISTGPVTAAQVGSVADVSTAIPVFWACALTIGSTSTKSMGFSLKVEVPIDQDNYCIGSKYLDSIIQSGNGTLSGSLSFAPSEWTTLNSAMGTCGNLGDIELILRGQSGTNCTTADIRTITIEDAVVSDSTYSGQNRNRFTKSLNWKAPVSTTVNNDLFSA